MDTAKVFMTGQGQAVQLPPEYRLDVDEVLISRVGAAVLLMPKEEAFDMLMEGINEFAEDCMVKGRDQGHQQERGGGVRKCS